VLDRASTFADPEIVELLKTRFVPVAIDQAYQRRQQDAEGEFYRKIAGQGPRNNFQSTTQGLYIATADGKLLSYNNNRGATRIKRLMREALESAQANKSKVPAVAAGQLDPRYNPKPPEGGLVVRVQAKVLGGYEKTDDTWRSIFQSALSRDNLWISSSEHQALLRGEIPATLQQRIARYHLVDNTRGEPPMWRENEVRELNMTLNNGRLSGRVRLQTDRGDRGYEAELLGRLEVKDGKVVRFDCVALGDFWGAGPFTGGAPKGKFPLGVSFTLADGADVADRVPPQASRGWVQGYIR
jgi:hypothetical protein